MCGGPLRFDLSRVEDPAYLGWGHAPEGWCADCWIPLQVRLEMEQDKDGVEVPMVVRLKLESRTNREIAQILGIHFNTVRAHLKRFAKNYFGNKVK